MNKEKNVKLDLFFNNFEKLREKLKVDFRDKFKDRFYSKTENDFRRDNKFKDRFYSKTAGFIDRMCCCSYSGQQMFNEADDMIYDLDDYSIVDTVWLEETIKDNDDINVKEKGHAADSDDDLWMYYKGVRGSISMGTEVTVASTYHQSPSITTCSLSSPPTQASTTPPPPTTTTTTTTNPSSSSTTADLLIMQSRQTAPTPREIAVPSQQRVPSELELMQQQEEEVGGGKDLRLWSQSSSKHESILRIQSESLAELPYLNMTEGYRC